MRAKSRPILCRTSDLVDTGQIVFDRIFGRNDLAIGSIKGVKGGIQGGCLAGAGWAGNQDDTVGAPDKSLEFGEVGLGETKLPHPHFNAVFVQQSHHRRLPVISRDDADPQIKLFFTDGDLNSAVLGSSSFSDVDAGQDFDTRDNRPQLATRQRISLVQHAVDAIPNADAIFERFDVNI